MGRGVLTEIAEFVGVDADDRWLDNKPDNYTFEPIPGGEEGALRVVVMDPGGIVPVRRDLGDPASLARDIQMHVNSPLSEANSAAFRDTYHRFRNSDYRKALIKGLITDEFGSSVNLAPFGVESFGNLQFNPLGVSNFPKARQLFALPPDEAAALYRQWRQSMP